MIILGTNSIKDTGYDVANSLRFNKASSDYLSRSNGTPTSLRKYTFSAWVKKTATGALHTLYSNGTNGDNYMYIHFNNSTEQLEYVDVKSGAYQVNLKTTRVFRDPSAWYHIMIAVDTTQGTNTNRVKFYINGVQETSFVETTYPDQNDDLILNGSNTNIGRYVIETDRFYDGYMSEVVFVDGTQQANTDLGEFDEDSGIWKPIDVSGLTFGDNGYYLDFENSGALGDDVSGNGNDFTVNNLTAVDQSTDTCTNNFCIFMSHTSGSYATLSEGGLISTGNSASDSGSSIASMGITNGKWYWEFEFDTQNSGYGLSGVIDTTAAKFGIQGGAIGYPVPNAYMISVGGNMSNGSSEQTGWTSDYSNGDVLGMAFDMDNGAWYMHLNGTYYNSGNPTSGGSRTGAVVSWTPNGKTLVPVVTSYNGSIEKFNFGSPPYAISSGNTDGNGYGNFEYAVPSGYYSLNTKNLSEYG